MRLTRNTYDEFNRRTRLDSPSYGTIAALTQSKYDDAGRRWMEVDADGKATPFVYDGLGRLIWVVTDVSSTLTSLPTGDPSGWPSPSARLPDSTVTRYDYDSLGRMFAQTDSNSHTTQFQYDRLDRRTRRTLPDGTSYQVWTYDYGSPEAAGKSETEALVRLSEEARKSAGYFDGPGGLQPIVPNRISQH